jgi:hypothetical protein
MNPGNQLNRGVRKLTLHMQGTFTGMERQSKVLVKRNFGKVKKRVLAHLLSKKNKEGFPGIGALRKLLKKGKKPEGEEEGGEGEEQKEEEGEEPVDEEEESEEPDLDLSNKSDDEEDDY